MSTRCQLQIIQEGGYEEKVTLYHHCDGYPKHIVEEDIPKAFELIGGSLWSQSGYLWEAGRAGKVAAYLCAAHPAGFEPLGYHDLHGDIEYYYRLYVKSDNQGIASAPQWELEIYEPSEGFWDDPCIENMRITRQRSPAFSVPIIA